MTKCKITPGKITQGMISQDKIPQNNYTIGIIGIKIPMVSMWAIKLLT